MMKKSRILIMLGMLIGVFSQQIKADDWPMLSHDPQHSGSTDEALLLPLELANSFIAGGPITGNSSPVIEDSIAYLGGIRNCMKAYNFSSGDIIWEFSDPVREMETPCIYGDFLYVSADIGQSTGSRVYKINKHTGAMIRYADVPGQPEPSCVAGGVVYVGYCKYWSGPYGLIALDADDLSVIWNFPNPRNHGMSQPAVSVDGARLFSSDGGGNLYCLDAATGMEIWSFSSGHPWGGNMPSLCDSTVYFVYGTQNVNVYALTTDGALLWEKHLENAGDASQAQAVANNIMYVGANKTLYALDLLNEGDVLWTFYTDSGCRSPSVAGGVVFVATEVSGGLYALDCLTGNVLWSYPCGGTLPQHGGPAIANNHLLFYMMNDAGDSAIVYDFASTAIVLSPISFPVTTAGDTSVVSFTIYNPKPEPLTLRGISVIEGPFYFNSGFEESLAESITIDAHASISNPLYFCPLDGGHFGRIIRFEKAGSGDFLASKLFQGEGRAISLEWTSAHCYPDLCLTQHQILNVLIEMNDQVEVDSLLLCYAVGGCGSYQTENMCLIVDDPVNDIYEGLLLGNEGGSRGLKLHIAAYNGSVIDSTHSPEFPVLFRVWANDLSFNEPQPASIYKMISIPVEMRAPKNKIADLLSNVLGNQDIHTWRMFAYSTSVSKYLEIPNDTIHSFEQGMAYWLITKDTVTLNIEEGLSTPIDRCFAITLDPGWNMIGNPFNFPVAWDSILVDTLTLAEVESTVVEPPVAWNINDGYRYGIAILEPFEGYWVKNLCDSVVVLRIPPIEAPAGASGGPAIILADVSTTGAAEDGWMIGIKASSGGNEGPGNYALTNLRAADFHNFAGVTTGASNHWDRKDRSEPPLSPGRSISLYFPHASWDLNPGNYSVDIRGKHEALKVNEQGASRSEEDLWGHIWRFDVAKSFSIGRAGDEVSLEFDGLESVPAEAVIYLVDRYLERLIDLRKERGYSFFLGKRAVVSTEEEARFILLVGSDEFIDNHEEQLPSPPSRTALYQNYPNPFNPSTIIRYEISKAGRVDLRIYDVRGTLIKILFSGHRNPGRYEAGWHGLNEKGNRVSSGIYFYRLVTSTGFVDTNKMLLIK